MVETTTERWRKAEVHRTAGTIAPMAGPAATKAEASFHGAVAIARDQQATSWELRAAMSMARLWRDNGKRQQAHDLLALVYGGFTESFDALDLKEGKELLEQLKTSARSGHGRSRSALANTPNLRGELRPAGKTPALDLWQVVLEIFPLYRALMPTDGSSL
jgi:hypothetical protein